MIDGMPQPPLLAFLADKAPHFVHLGFASALDVHGHLVWFEGAQQRRVDRLQHGFFLSKFAQDSVCTDAQHPRSIAHPTGIEAHVNDLLFHLGQTAAVVVVKEKTPSGTRCVLVSVAWYPRTASRLQPPGAGANLPSPPLA